MNQPVLNPPVSKSDAQRALILADIIGASSPLTNVRDAALPGDVKIVRDGLWALRHHKSHIDVHDGGAPFRFLLTQAALTPGTQVSFTGSARLASRPHDQLIKSLQNTLSPLGVTLTFTAGQWPVTVQTPDTPLSVAAFSINGAESSQFASSLMLGAARLVARTHRPVRLELSGPTASAGYLDMTIRWLEGCGFTVENVGAGVTVTGFQEPRTVPSIPGDWSSLTYLLPIAWKCGAQVEAVSLQADHPDKRIIEHLRSVGLELRFVGRQRTVVDGALSDALDCDASAAPDLVPALVAVATALQKPSVFKNISILRLKESDRVAGLQSLADAIGARTVVQGDRLTVTPGTPRDSFTFDARADHRLAMASVTAAILNGSRLKLTGAESVSKSFPSFFEELQQLPQSKLIS